MYITDDRLARVTLPPTAEQRQADQQASLEKLVTWQERKRELRALLVVAIQARDAHDGVITHLENERRSIRGGPKDDLWVDPYGWVHEGISADQVARHEQIRGEVAKREAARERWLVEPAALRQGWDRMGRPRPWSIRNVGDLEVQLRDALKTISWLEQEAGVAAPLT